MNKSFDLESRLRLGLEPVWHEGVIAASIQSATLAVSDLARSISFYHDVIGLPVLDRTVRTASFGFTPASPLLLLEEQNGVRPIPERSRLGLYYAGFRLPDRRSLAAFALHLAKKRIRYGAADHGVAEGIYLLDPDGLTVKVYTDRSSSKWPVQNNELVIGNAPLDLASLLNDEPDTWMAVPSGTKLGHIHLFVADLRRSKRLYCDGLGLAIASTTYSNALFLAPRDLRDHIGLSTWAKGAPPAGPGDARLLQWQLNLPNPEEFSSTLLSMRRQGWTDISKQDNTFVDDCGLVLQLVSQ